MKDFEWLGTQELWDAIAHNARQARRTTNWVELLDNIKVLCALIDERIEVFQRSQRREQLLTEDRSGDGDGLRRMIKSRGGDKREI
jgi:hypothetical protein